MTRSIKSRDSWSRRPILVSSSARRAARKTGRKCAGRPVLPIERSEAGAARLARRSQRCGRRQPESSAERFLRTRPDCPKAAPASTRRSSAPPPCAQMAHEVRAFRWSGSTFATQTSPARCFARDALGALRAHPVASARQIATAPWPSPRRDRSAASAAATGALSNASRISASSPKRSTMRRMTPGLKSASRLPASAITASRGRFPPAPPRR